MLSSKVPEATRDILDIELMRPKDNIESKNEALLLSLLLTLHIY